MGEGASWPSTQSSLLIRIREADNQEAWTTFVELYMPLIYRYGRRRGLQDADARDLVQEVLARVAKAIRAFEYDPARGQFRGWLGTLTRHALQRLLTRGKKAHTEAFAPMPEDVESETDAVWIEEFNAQVYQCAIDRVRPEFDAETWSIFESVWVQDRKPGDVAGEMGRKRESIYKAKFRVLQRLKEEVLFLAADLAVLMK